MLVIDYQFSLDRRESLNKFHPNPIVRSNVNGRVPNSFHENLFEKWMVLLAQLFLNIYLQWILMLFKGTLHEEACYNCICLCISLFVYRHAQALAALQAYSHWLAQFYNEVHNQNQSQFISLITSAVDAGSPLITTKVVCLSTGVISWLHTRTDLFLQILVNTTFKHWGDFLKQELPLILIKFKWVDCDIYDLTKLTRFAKQTTRLHFLLPS